MNDHGMTERRVLVRGLSTCYYEAGKGPVILLVHGVASSARDWREVMEDLSVSHRVLCPVLPGLGGTTPIEDVRPVSVASFVVDFLDALEVESVVVVGHSYGGAVAAELTLARPRLVTRLVLVDSAGLGRVIHPLTMLPHLLPRQGLRALSAVPAIPGAAAVLTLFANVMLRQPWRIPPYVWLVQNELFQSQQVLHTTLEVFRTGVGLTGQRDNVIVVDRLHEITVPTLVVWGATDQLLPVCQGRAAARRLPAGRFALLLGAGHISYLDSHEDFMDVVGPFVRDDPRPAQPVGHEGNGPGERT